MVNRKTIKVYVEATERDKLQSRAKSLGYRSLSSYLFDCGLHPFGRRHSLFLSEILRSLEMIAEEGEDSPRYSEVRNKIRSLFI